MNSTNIDRRNALKMLTALGVSAAAPRQSYGQSPVPESPRDRIVFDNEKVRVVRHPATPGQDVYVATPQRFPRLALFLTDATVRSAAAGKKVGYSKGALVWLEGAAGSAENAGAVESVVYLVEPKGIPPASPGDREQARRNKEAPPPNVGGKVLLDNAWVRVIEHVARPRMGVCGMGMHTHPPHLTIGITDGRVKIVEPGKEPAIREAKAGTVFWDEGGPHAIQNLSSRDTRAILIEFKGA